MADAEPPTTADLVKAGLVTGERVDIAVSAIMSDPRAGRFVIADGLYLDLAVVVRRSKHTRLLLKYPDATEGLKRGVFRKAILMARPVAG